LARVFAVLKALSAAFRRDWKSFGSIAVNNFFPVTLFFLRQAGVFVYLLAGVVMLFPMSTDPLRKIPRSRLDSWPLTRGDRVWLRVLSPLVNPVTWVLAALGGWAVWGRLTFGVVAIAVAVFFAGFTLSELPVARGVWFWRRVPSFPGPLNQLVRKNLREILSTLDFYVALLLALCATAWRAFGPALPKEAYLQMSLLALLALSSYTQCLFGLDGDGGFSRYRLLPLPGWKILAAKDAAFLLAAVALTLPLTPLAGLAAALVCLAFGHGPSVAERREQLRWRFSSGGSLYFGFLQVIGMAVAGAGVEFGSGLLLLPCAAVWAASLWWHSKSVENAFVT
jgi:hypothetical protein